MKMKYKMLFSLKTGSFEVVSFPKNYSKKTAKTSLRTQVIVLN